MARKFNHRLKQLENRAKNKTNSLNNLEAKELELEINTKCFPLTIAYVNKSMEYEELKDMKDRVNLKDIPQDLLYRVYKEQQHLGLKPDTIKKLRKLFTSSEEYEKYFASGRFDYEYNEEELKEWKNYSIAQKSEHIHDYIDQLKSKES